MTANCRVGIGYDIHRLAEGRKLVLGGVAIDFPLGLLGHSDGDVVLHAVTDALLGAAGLGDIGDLFPDTDPAYRDADSKQLLAQVMEQVARAGFAANNIDLIVHAEKPKLTEHKRAIAASIAKLTGLQPECVNVKAKTNEGLGPLGHADGIACTATASIVRDH
ncbi:MAG: 2-C-methyl-D-erythritol 2,4-cyclodiphosphate synthase [bacterium]|nr:2-C-methyl-D-erythritol 2,4-cyclodiphosphate synthase [bacterium]